jgi:hypothetical protein
MAFVGADIVTDIMSYPLFRKKNQEILSGEKRRLGY